MPSDRHEHYRLAGYTHFISYKARSAVTKIWCESGYPVVQDSMQIHLNRLRASPDVIDIQVESLV